MERSHGNGTYAYNSTEPLDPRPSIESLTSARLQKKRSVARVRSDLNHLSSKPRTQAYARANPDETHRRKSSIRDAVRKIFSRRSKLQEPPAQITPLNHRPHNSQPPPETSPSSSSSSSSSPSPPPPPPPLPPPSAVIDTERALSTSLPRDTASVDLPRIRSPNAVEFPKSRHLKPLALPTPFDDPRGTLRRRKTLPSILVAPEDAKEIAAALSTAAYNHEPPPGPVIGLAVSTSKKAKRRSRSAGELGIQAIQPGPQRKRSDEIRFWRESIQTAILRPTAYTADPESTVTETDELKSTPPRNSTIERFSARGSRLFDSHSPSAFGTDFSRDLEDRVAKIEANLQFFQRSLHKLQSNKRRRAADLLEPNTRSPTYARRDSADFRTPSMLAEDLHIPLAPSDYRYAFEPTERPSTAPSRPVRPPRPDESAPPVPVIRQPVAEPQPLQQQQQQQQPSRRPARSDNPTTPISAMDNTTFSSLYQMLSNERSARHRLESELRDMRTEITDLQHQVSAQSQIQSQRSSYLFPTVSDVTVGSSRLRDLLAEAEGSSRRSTTPPPPPVLISNKVVSRFSASTRQESEAGVTQASSEELQDRDLTLEHTSRQDKSRHLENMEEEAAGDRMTYDDYKTPTQAGCFPRPPSYSLSEDGEMF